MKQLILVVLTIFSSTILSISSNKNVFQNDTEIQCSENHCEGSYVGPEFVNSSDVAHQFSNTMSGKVGDKLKELYSRGSYCKVDMPNIIMTTKGMGTGKVIYTLKIPFLTVNKKCEAYTSFDHVGGWNHKPALERRKRELSGVLMDGQSFDISNLKTTSEGLQEYWIQWKNKIMQSSCK